MRKYERIINQYIEEHDCKFEGIIDGQKGYKIVRNTFAATVVDLRWEFESKGMIFIKNIPWTFSHKGGKVCCQIQFFNPYERKFFTKNINLIGLRWRDILPY